MTKDLKIEYNPAICGYSLVDPPTEEQLRHYYTHEYVNPTDRPEDDTWRTMLFMDYLYELYVKTYDLSILDIGAGRGVFGAFLRQFGCKVKDIDAQEDLDLDIQMRYVCNSREQFDLISMWIVLNHTLDPINMLKCCHNGLKVDGKLMLSVPRCDGTLHSDHLHYWDSQGLRTLLETHGFKVIYETTTYPTELFGEDKLAAHKARMKFDQSLNRPARKKIYETMAAEGIGREIVLIAQKVG